jgi:SAM-dependent methyltransferase
VTADSQHWADYYKVTVDRPAWATVRFAIDRFKAEDDQDRSEPRYALDLGCGSGRDTRELLRAGWKVLAVDREPGAETALDEALARAREAELKARLQIRIEDLATVAIPACDLVNASLCLPFLDPDSYRGTWNRIGGGLGPGARFAAMLFGDHDESAADPAMTCLSPETIRADLAGFEIEFWAEKEEDSQTALGEPHHIHLIEFVARRIG